MRRLVKMLIVAALPVFVLAGVITALLTKDWIDGLLSFGAGITVASLIVAVFSQPGAVQLSPQREVAISTGHSDRRDRCPEED